jgi:uncharacterized hydrophobic protein (TIGR00271 family)
MTTPHTGATLNDVSHMRDSVLFEGADGRNKVTRFWMLLVLSSVIAAAGVIGDSTATVIGAMIVAPMMLPIQGIMLAVVLGDRRSLLRSVFFVVAGASASIAIGWAVGFLDPNSITAATNAQVAGRVSPGLTDLLAALGTGVVGSIALIRKDISDTLPGVAIAISLVPPLVVVGLTLESGAFSESFGALFLFVANVAAILTTGLIVAAIYGVRRRNFSRALSDTPVARRTGAYVAIGSLFVIVAGVLSLSTIGYTFNAFRESSIYGVATDWASDSGWKVISVNTEDQDHVVVRVEGPIPAPDPTELRTALTAANIDATVVGVVMVPVDAVDLGDLP